MSHRAPLLWLFALAPLTCAAQDFALARDWENEPRTLILHPQPPAEPPAPAADSQPSEPPGPAVVTPTRADLAHHYLNVDRVFMPLLGDGPRRVSDETIARFNRDFDAITGLFFGGNFPAAIAKLDELAQVMLTTGGGEPAPSIGTSISVSVEPPLWWPGSPATPRVRVRSYWVSSLDEKATLEFLWDDGRAAVEGRPSLTREIELKKGRAVELDVPLADFAKWPEGGDHWPVKTYTVSVRVRGHREWGEARFGIVPRSPDTARVINDKKLVELLGAQPALESQITLCRARNRVLVDYPGTTDSAEFLADYPALLNDIEREIAELSEGRNPYTRRAGEIYRPIVGKGTPNREPVPCVVYAPSKATDDTPRPVVVALHGAGGDESMFVRAYGAGRLAQLAEENGFIVASVQSYKIGGKAPVFDLLIDQLARDYSVDRSRIYVIGHSLGAGAATFLASARPDSIAGVVCFAGFGRAGARCAPTLVITGALDPLIRARDGVGASSVRASVDEAAARKLPVEFREDPNYGHTLIVGAKLDEAVKWCLSRSLKPAIPPVSPGQGN